jgi:hypothetical protein
MLLKNRATKGSTTPINTEDTSKPSTEELARRIQHKLDAAEKKRQDNLAAVQAKAARSDHLITKAAETLAARRVKHEARIQHALTAASIQRKAHLEAKTAHAARDVARARELQARNEQEQGVRLDALLYRLDRAASFRKEQEESKISSLPQTIPANSFVTFLTKEGAKKTALLRQSSSRKLQQSWRSFAARHGTTRSLAQGFILTGVPFCVDLGPPLIGPSQSPLLQPSTSASSPSPSTFLPSSSHPHHHLIKQPSFGAVPRGSPIVQHGALSSSPTIPSLITSTPPRSSHHHISGAPTAPPTPEKPPINQKQGGHNEESDGNVDPFDKLAAAISSPVTLKASQALLRRLQRRLIINRQHTITANNNKANNDENDNGDQHYKLMDAAVNSLLKRVMMMPPPRRSPPSRPTTIKKKQQPTTSTSQQQQQFVDRYPPRIFLCAYMVLAHPEVVFNTKGEREDSLMEASREMVSRFESLLVHIAQPLITTVTGVTGGGVSSSSPLASQVTSHLDQITLDDANDNDNDEENLSIIVGEEEGGDNNDDDDEKESSFAESMGAYLLRSFDEAWISYLEQFVAWKSADAAGLEGELIRVAVELEVSKLTKLQRTTSNPADLQLGATTMAVSGSSNTPKRLISQEDIAALADGVARDLELIEQRVKRLTGGQGAARLHAALVAARANVADLHYHQQQQQSMSMSGLFTSSTMPMSTSSSTGSVNAAATGGAGLHTPEHFPAQSFKINKTNAPPYLPLSNKNAITNEEEERSAMGMSTTTTNLALLWQLLHDPNWRLPSAEADALWQDAIQPNNNNITTQQCTTSTTTITSVTDLQLKIKRIADQALWDTIKERLLLSSSSSSSPSPLSAAGAAASILAELGSSVCEVLPPQSPLTHEIQSYLNATALERDLSPPPPPSTTMMMVNLPRLFELLEWSARLLRDLGAPAREQEALGVHTRVRTRLSSAATALASNNTITNTATMKEEMATAVVQALRVLAGQLRLLRLDAANAHLSALVKVLGPDGGVAYARSKMEEQGGILGPLDDGHNNNSSSNSNDGISCRLPHTRGWLALVSSQLPHVEHLLADTSSSTGDQGVPAQLRSGLRTSTSGSSSSSSLLKNVSALQPCQPRSWQGLIRLGLVSLVAGEGAVNRIAVPEVLRLDTIRLRECQDEFQRLLVLSTAIIIITQSTSSSSSSSSSREQQSLEGIKSRLNAVMADPNMKLADLACELNIQCGGEPGDATREGVLADSLKRMLSRDSPALKSIMAGLTNALIALLVVSGGSGGSEKGGSSGGGQYVAEVALRKCGVLEAVGKDVEGLAGKLAGVGGVVERVCQPWLERVCEDLI